MNDQYNIKHNKIQPNVTIREDSRLWQADRSFSWSSPMTTENGPTLECVTAVTFSSSIPFLTLSFLQTGRCKSRHMAVVLIFTNNITSGVNLNVITYS